MAKDIYRIAKFKVEVGRRMSNGSICTAKLNLALGVNLSVVVFNWTEQLTRLESRSLPLFLTAATFHQAIDPHYDALSSQPTCLS